MFRLNGQNASTAWWVQDIDVLEDTQADSTGILAYVVMNSHVNREIFASVLFARNFAYAKFREKNPLKNAKSLCR